MPSPASTCWPRGRPRPTVWLLNVVADLAIPEVRGRRTIATRVLNHSVTRVQLVAEHDPVAAPAFMRAIALLAPPTSLMRPTVAARVLLGGLQSRRRRR